MSTLQELTTYFFVGLLTTLLKDLIGFFWKPMLYVLETTRFVVGMAYAFFLVRWSKNQTLWSINLAGGSLNALALIANGGKMPVFSKYKGKFQGIHKRGDRHSRLKALCDIHQGVDGIVYSTGDVLISISLLLLVIKAVYEKMREVTRVKRKFVTSIWSVR